jgi:hypothetical protein
MRVDLVRLESSDDHGTFGTLLIDGEAFCVTLEPVALNNIAYLSCIPTGVYLCRAHNSPTYGKTFEVTDVPQTGKMSYSTQGIVTKIQQGAYS